MTPIVGAGGSASRATEEEALLARLSTLPLDGEPDPAWASRTRGRLVAMAAVRTPAAEPRRRSLAPPVWRTRLTAGLAGVATAVTGLAAVVELSADAQPGDALYGVKQGTEQTRLALAGDARGRTLLEFASTRLEELAAALPDDPPADVVADTLSTMDAQTTGGAAWLAQRAVETGAGAPLDELARWSSGQSAGLAGLLSGVPSPAADDAASSADLLARIDDRVTALRAALACPSGPAVDGSDALGPAPGECSATALPAGGAQPSAPVTDEPPSTAAPTPAAPSGGGGGSTGAGGSSGAGTTGGADTDSGGSPHPRSTPRPPAPPLPSLPLPSLPTLIPDPTGGLRPPGGSSAPAAPSLDLGICLPPLPVLGDC